MARKRKNLKELSKPYYQIEFRTPGLIVEIPSSTAPGGVERVAMDKFSMSSGSKDRNTRDDYHSKLRMLYQQGEHELLLAVKSRKIALSVMAERLNNGGVPALRAHWDELRALQSATQPQMLLTDFLPAFLEAPSGKGKRKGAKTRADYDAYIRAFASWRDLQLNGPLPNPEGLMAKPPRERVPVTLSELRKGFISEFVLHLMETPSERFKAKEVRSAKTAVAYRAALSAFCSWLVQEGHLSHNPVQETARPEVPENTDPAYLTTAMLGEWMDASREYDAERIAAWGQTFERTGDQRYDPARIYPDTLFWRFLVSTGATTYNEGCRVCLSDVFVEEDPTSAEVRVFLRGTKTATRPRDVYISRSLALDLALHAEKHNIGPFDPLFRFGKNEGSHVFYGVQTILVHRRGRDVFSRLRAYDLRHTYAVHLAQGNPETKEPGVDLLTLQQLMGHKRIETTMIYAKHVSPFKRHFSGIMLRKLGL